LSQATRLPNFGLRTKTSLFRQDFEVEDVNPIRTLVLPLQYKHGLLLWLNGHLILNEGFDGLSPESLPTDALAALRSDNLFEERDLSHAIPFLVSGKNVLAAEVHTSINQILMAFVAELNGNFARPPGVHQLSSEAAVISWRTLKPKQATIAYGLTPNMNHRITLQDARVEPEIAIIHLHPGQTYYWQVTLEGPEGIGTSSMSTFQTPDPKQDKVSFAVIGDSGLGTLGQYDVANQIRQADPDHGRHCLPITGSGASGSTVLQHLHAGPEGNAHLPIHRQRLNSQIDLQPCTRSSVDPRETQAPAQTPCPASDR